MHYKLINFINDLCSTLSNRYGINCGGCCYLTYLLAKNLEELKVNYSLVIQDDNIKSLYNKKIISKIGLRKAINSNKVYSNGYDFTSCCHYTVAINGITCNVIPYSNEWQSLSIAHVKSDNILGIYEHGCWNPYYDSTFNPVVKRFINYAFKKYEKSQN